MGNARFQRKLKTDLPYDPAIPLLGIYVKEMESPPHRDHVHCSTVHSQDMETF